MRLNNYREPVGENLVETQRSGAAGEQKGSARGEPPKLQHVVEDISPDVNSLDNFLLEDIPTKMILID
jgi:hypothetical protein